MSVVFKIKKPFNFALCQYRNEKFIFNLFNLSKKKKKKKKKKIQSLSLNKFARNHSYSTHAKISEKLLFLTPSITASRNILANANLCFRVLNKNSNLQKVINKNVCYLYSVC